MSKEKFKPKGRVQEILDEMWGLEWLFDSFGSDAFYNILDVAESMFFAGKDEYKKKVNELWGQLELLGSADEIRSINGGMVCPWTIEGCALMREFKGIIRNVFGEPKEKVKKK